MSIEGKYLVGKFSLEFREGALLIFGEDGSELSSADYLGLRDSLYNSYMHKKKREAVASIGELCTSGTWVFPRNPNDLKQSGECVYFLVSVDKFNLIKVGHSGNLHQRVKALSFKISKPKVIAFIRTPQPETLEMGIHTQLASHRHEGEWFDAGGVYTFIDQWGRAK